jgi:hypothetical protein
MRMRPQWAVLVCLMIATVVVWPPTQGAEGQIATEQCTPARPPLQPEEPLEMNTVVVDRLFKTVVMEKEVFVCLDAEGAATQIVDLETFIEIVERAVPRKSGGVRLVDKRVEVAKCVKDFVEGFVRCEPRKTRVRTIDVPLEGCEINLERPGTPRDPVVMTTDVAAKVVKTVMVEKEVFNCGEMIGDLYLFTEIIEAPDDRREPTTLKPVLKRFQGILCVKDPTIAEIRSCREFTPFSGPG